MSLKHLVMKFITNRLFIGLFQLTIAYLGWNMTAVTIVNSSFNSMGLFLIILAIFLRDVVNGSVWLYNWLEFNNE